MERLARAHATEMVLLERIRELRSFRSWYRRQANWAMWMDLAARNDDELRALLRIARKARRLADAAPDPITEAKAWAAAAPGEWVEAYGR